MSPGVVMLFVLVALVALAGASFFRNMLAALLVLIGIPVAIVLQAAIGLGTTVFAIGLLTLATMLVHTINCTLRELRAANRVRTRRRVA